MQSPGGDLVRFRWISWLPPLSGQIVVDGIETDCGRLSGSVSLTDLADADGITFAPLSFEASGPVCYGG